MVVGVPAEDLGHMRNAGMLQTFFAKPSPAAATPITAPATVPQASAAMPVASEQDDRWCGGAGR